MMNKYGAVYKSEQTSKVFTPPFSDFVDLVTVLNVSSNNDFINEWPNTFHIEEHLREVVVEVSTGVKEVI